MVRFGDTVQVRNIIIEHFVKYWFGVVFVGSFVGSIVFSFLVTSHECKALSGKRERRVREKSLYAYSGTPLIQTPEMRTPH